VRLYDQPAPRAAAAGSSSPRSAKAELEAIVADYVAKAKKIGYVPMCGF
jgi:hypothetical protein